MRDERTGEWEIDYGETTRRSKKVKERRGRLPTGTGESVVEKTGPAWLFDQISKGKKQPNARGTAPTERGGQGYEVQYLHLQDVCRVLTLTTQTNRPTGSGSGRYIARQKRGS